jgi:hypothetical protein
LGNGASIALDSAFRYGSLLEEARQNDLISNEVDKLFDHYGTRDFELVLKRIWQAKFVNQTLDIEEDVTPNVYEGLREALIRSVNHNHAEYTDVNGLLDNASQFASGFNCVLSLNYDLTLYWAINRHNEDKPIEVQFKDCFAGENYRFRHDWRELQTPIHGEDRVSLVFYPHGNLLLAVDQNGQEKKLTRANQFDDLLVRITREWEEGEVSPLFVSEGATEQKKAAILRSAYLSAVYNEVLPWLGESLVIYGWSLGDQDEHILESIFRYKGQIERIALSVYTEGESDPQDYCNRVKEKIHNFDPNSSVIFFDSASDGAWIY